MARSSADRKAERSRCEKGLGPPVTAPADRKSSIRLRVASVMPIESSVKARPVGPSTDSTGLHGAASERDIGRDDDGTWSRALRNPVIGLVHPLRHHNPFDQRIARHGNRRIRDDKDLQPMPLGDAIDLRLDRAGIGIDQNGNRMCGGYGHADAPARRSSAHAMLAMAGQQITMMNRIFFINCACALISTLAVIGIAAAADDPLTRVVAPKDGATVCYQRICDNAHLKRNPKQQSKRALLSFKYQGDQGIHIERIMLTRRDKQPPLYFAGGCDWSEKANRDGRGDILMKGFPKDAGYACIALTASGSAEEGGMFLIDFPADGETATLHLDSPIRSMSAAAKSAKGGSIELGSADRVFRLQRTKCFGLCRA